MNEAHFKQQHQERWQQLDEVMNVLEKGQSHNDRAAELPTLFRQAAADLSIAQQRMMGNRVCDQLNHLVQRSYQLMNAGVGGSISGVVAFFLQTFPQRVREEWRIVILGFVLFALPFIAMIKASETSPEWIFSYLSPQEIQTLDTMYGNNAKAVEDGSSSLGDVGSSFTMFGFYVKHNIGIGLRTFALGSVFAVGAVYELLFEGAKLGAMFGYVHYTGNGAKIWQFAVSHSSFELLGLILCGVAGIRLGLGVLLPGRLSRGQSLRASGLRAVPILLGGVCMVFTAAIVEGFWSPRAFIPVEVKFGFGITMWIAWFGYFFFVGRRRHA